MLRSLFEGAQYNSEAGAKCTVYSRARTKQGCGVIKEIRYIILLILYFLLMVNFPLPMDYSLKCPEKLVMLWAQFLSPKVVVIRTYLRFMTEARLIDLYYVCVYRAGATKTEDVVIQ